AHRVVSRGPARVLRKDHMAILMRGWLRPATLRLRACLRQLQACGLVRALLLTAPGWIYGTSVSVGADLPHTEYQIKALFLLNFVKYVDWPDASFVDTNSPVIIGIFGEDKFGDALKNAVEGKTVAGRRVVTQPVDNY